MISIRRKLMAQVGIAPEPILPAEYQQVEYIECTGTQYIKTDFKPSSTGLSVDVDYMFTASQTGSDQYMFFAIGSGPIVSAECYVGSRWYAYCGIVTFSNPGVLYGVGNTLDVKHSMTLDSISETFTIDGTTANKSGNRNNGSLNELALFGRYDGTYLNNGLRIYSFVVKNNAVESANFVPCYRKQDSEPGVYDLVSNAFYTNAGTGTFLVGRNIN